MCGVKSNDSFTRKKVASGMIVECNSFFFAKSRFSWNEKKLSKAERCKKIRFIAKKGDSVRECT